LTLPHFAFVEEDRNVVLVGGRQEFWSQIFLFHNVRVDELDESFEGFRIDIFDFNLSGLAFFLCLLVTESSFEDRRSGCKQESVDTDFSLSADLKSK
jgi:hypothetical protein